MAKKKSPQTKTIRNRRASFDYQLGNEFVVGIVLNGRETKALRLGRGQLQGAYVNVRNGELFLIGAVIHGSNGIPIDEKESTQDRKLLANRKEIDKLVAARQQGMSIVPVALMTKSRFIKLRIAIGKGKKTWDKRQTIKKRDDTRNSQREMRQY